ncbi:MAG: YoaK family protein [Oscillospiraceae bacterium]
MKRKNTFESFLFIFILTLIGGFINSYTFILHDGYLSTMNTGNMARMGLAISRLEFQEAATYLMSIFANAFGAMMAFICREKFENGVKDRWQRKCLKTELIIFLIIGFLPSSLPHFFINFLISSIAGFQLATFTTWNGNLVATTIASGNIRFVGEHLGNAIINPSKKSFLNFLLFLSITLAFVLGVIIGALSSNLIGKFSIYIVCVLISSLIFIENMVATKTNNEYEKQVA